MSRTYCDDAYLGSYPHLRIANESGIPYHVVLLLADVVRRMRAERRLFVSINPHERSALDYMNLKGVDAAVVDRVNRAIVRAARWHDDQKAGRIDMDGKVVQ